VALPPSTESVDRTVRMSAAQRRDSILDAAIDEFTRVGYQGATVARIAAAAGCSEPNLYKRFRDKRALLLASLDLAQSQVEGELDRVAGMQEPLPALFELIRTSPWYRRMLLLRLLCSTMPDDVELLERLRSGTQRLLDRFHVAIEHRKRLGLTPQHVDAWHVGWTWLGLSLAACHHMLVDGPDAFDRVIGVGERYLVGMFGADAPA
jgi:AcrR family transcriptional regulator